MTAAARWPLMANAATSGSSRKPNIIFVMADDLGYGHLGCYGQDRIKTPNLDRMAAEGVKFTSAYSGSPVCAPSRCTLMTGLHQGHAWVRGNFSVATQDRVALRPQDVTVAEVLKGAGYATGIFGKWGLGEPETTGVPNRQGFDEWFGYLNQRHAHGYYPDHLWENETRVDLPDKPYSHDLFTAKALDFVKRHQQEPFFLYLPYTIPHALLEPPSDAPYSNEDWPQPEKNLAAMITALDDDMGKLFGLLKELGIDRDTIVFFTSDNGPHSEGGADSEFFDGNGPLRGMKRSLYDGGIRVPMIARWPGHIQPGRQSAYPWMFQDFLPTAAHLAGAEAPEAIDGISVLPEILGKPQPRRDYLYWEFFEGGFLQAVRLRDWKGVRLAKDGPIELYDLRTDIGEEHDVADQNPLVVKTIEKIMREAHTESQHWPAV